MKLSIATILLFTVSVYAVCNKDTCGNACVDISKDQHNCGACGNACPSGSHCSNGQCICEAAKKNLLPCGDACVAVCSSSGNSPFWSNSVFPGGGVQFVTVTSAAECCMTCYTDPNCRQWAMFGSICEHNVGTTCVSPTLLIIGAGGGRCPNQPNGCGSNAAAVHASSFNVPPAGQFGAAPV